MQIFSTFCITLSHVYIKAGRSQCSNVTRYFKVSNKASVNAERWLIFKTVQVSVIGWSELDPGEAYTGELPVRLF